MSERRRAQYITTKFFCYPVCCYDMLDLYSFSFSNVHEVPRTLFVTLFSRTPHTTLAILLATL